MTSAAIPQEQGLAPAVPLTAESVSTVVAMTSLRYSGVLESAPPVPRPLPPGYLHISAIAGREEALRVAPIAPVTATGDLLERQLYVLRAFFLRASEFTHLHLRRRVRNVLSLGLVQWFTLVISILVTLLLRVYPENDMVTIISAVGTILVSTANSWIAFAWYEDLVAAHGDTAHGFEEIARDLLSAVRATDADAARVLQSKVEHLVPDVATRLLDALGTATWAARGESNLVQGARERALGLRTAADRIAASASSSVRPGATPLPSSTVPPPTSAPRSAAEAAPTAPDATGGADDDANFRARLVLRRATELRVLHATLAAIFRVLTTVLVLVMLIASSTASLLLFSETGVTAPADAPAPPLGLREGEEAGADRRTAIAGLIAGFVAALNAVMRMVDLSGRAASHSLASRQFASIARDTTTLLTVESLAAQAAQIAIMEFKMDSAEAEAPALPPAFIIRLWKDANGEPRLPVLSSERPEAGNALLDALQALRGQLSNLLRSAPSPSALLAGVVGRSDDLEDPLISATRTVKKQSARRTAPKKPGGLDKSIIAQAQALGLNNQVLELGERFNNLYDAMPALPWRLPADYQRISFRAVLRDAEAAAPLDEGGEALARALEAQSPSKRGLDRLVTWYAKATELRALHTSLSETNRVKLTRVQLVALAIATLVTLALLTSPGTGGEEGVLDTIARRILPETRNEGLNPFFSIWATVVMVAAGIGSAVVSFLTSWTKFARYEALTASHIVSARGFADLCTDLHVVFVQLRALSVRIAASKGRAEPDEEVVDVLFRLLDYVDSAPALVAEAKSDASSVSRDPSPSRPQARAAPGQRRSTREAGGSFGERLRSAMASTEAPFVPVSDPPTPASRLNPVIQLQVRPTALASRRPSHLGSRGRARGGPLARPPRSGLVPQESGISAGL